ncbi:MAG: hypothetical protein RI897_706 [Verrucomicrobiota bacterium]|jgi:hypothetical protein
MDYAVESTARGFRLVQHGVVLSEVLRHPGPTHSVFDVLAALAVALRADHPIGLLGFAAGSLMAPLRCLSSTTPVRAVDLDAAGFGLFREVCWSWAGDMIWEQGDAVEWLERQYYTFPVLIDDLSVPSEGDVVKPIESGGTLLGLMKRKLAPGGVVISNFLRPESGGWSGVYRQFRRVHRSVRVVLLEEYENRILVGGQSLPAAGRLGAELRRVLGRLGSRQAAKVRIRTVV